MRTILAIPFAIVGIVLAGFGVLFFAGAALFSLVGSAIFGED